MSIETARIELLAVAELVEEACRVAALRPAAHHTIAPRAVVGDAGQVAVTAAVGDLVAADRDQALRRCSSRRSATRARRSARPCPTRSAAGRRSASWPSAAPATRRRPRSRACSASPARAHGTASKRAPQPRHHSRRSSHSMMQRLAPRSRWRQRLTRRPWIVQPAGLPAARADAPPAPQPDRDDHPLGAEADVDHRRAGQA